MTLKSLPQAGGESNSRKLVIAIDFGTTWSGVAWAQSARPEIQSVVQQWPDVSGSLEAETSDKVPTQIAFNNGQPAWGFSIPDTDLRYMWFKLGLDPRALDEVSHLSLEYPDPKALPHNADKEAVELVAEYLTCMRKHVYSILKFKLGQGVLDSTPIEYVLTVPAMWSDAAKDRTATCASQAGMGNVQLVSEPEAAVVYALDAMDPHNLQVGDTFVLCDAGGGTVDLISYTIEQFSPKVKVSEAVPGDGDACGSTFLNRIFGDWLDKTFGKDEEFDAEVKEMAMTAFEKSAKRKFTGDESHVVVPVVGMSNNADHGIKRGRLSIPATTVKSIFAPVITMITTLVKQQVKQTKGVKAILLVGGFGQSPYLRKCLEKIVGPRIEVMQPTNGWTAVVRGALIRGLNTVTPETSRISIGSRKARKFYGIRVGVAFDSIAHQGRHKYWDGYSGWRVEEMRWLVKKNDTVEEDVPVSHSFNTHKESDSQPFSDHRTRIYVYDSKLDEPAPRFPSSKIRKLAELDAETSSIPIAKIMLRKGEDGKMYNVLSHDIKVNFFSAHTEYTLWYQGKQYGKVTAEYA